MCLLFQSVDRMRKVSREQGPVSMFTLKVNANILKSQTLVNKREETT